MAKIRKVQIKEAKSSPIARGRRLKSLRMMAGLSRKKFEDKYKISAGTLQCWEDGRYNGLSAKGALKITEALKQEGIHATVVWLLYGIGIGPQVSDRLYLETLENDSQDTAIATELLTFRNNNRDAINLIVKDDGMQPVYSMGDYVGGCRRFESQDINLLIGRDCIVELVTGEILLRRIWHGSRENHYTLVCTNPNPILVEPILHGVELISAALVVWHRTKDIK